MRAVCAMIEQKVPLVCYRTGSDEIVGVFINFVNSKEDHFTEQFYQSASYFSEFISTYSVESTVLIKLPKLLKFKKLPKLLNFY